MMHISEPPAVVELGDGDARGHMQRRLLQIWLTLLTVLVTTWFCTLGPIPAVLALVTAKHVLVALLALGLRLDAPRETALPG